MHTHETIATIHVVILHHIIHTLIYNSHEHIIVKGKKQEHKSGHTTNSRATPQDRDSLHVAILCAVVFSAWPCLSAGSRLVVSEVEGGGGKGRERESERERERKRERGELAGELVHCHA